MTETTSMNGLRHKGSMNGKNNIKSMNEKSVNDRIDQHDKYE